MDLNKNYIKKTIYLKGERPHPVFATGSFETANLLVDKNVSTYQQDMYISVFLTKTCEIFEYVDVKKDEKIFVVERQNINPYYIDFDFFNSAKRIKINSYSDLTLPMLNYLNVTYFDSINSPLYQGDVMKWFNEVGYNQLINDETITVEEATGRKTKENGLDKLEKIQLNANSIISKTFYFPISINK